MPASEVVDGKLDAGRTAAVVATEARDVDEPHDAIARPAKPATAAAPAMTEAGVPGRNQVAATSRLVALAATNRASVG